MSSMYNEDDFNAFLLCTITYLSAERPSGLVLSLANAPAALSQVGEDGEPEPPGKGRVKIPWAQAPASARSGLASPPGASGAMRKVITAARCLLLGEWRGAGSACASSLVFRALP